MITVINPTSIYGPNYFHQSHFHFNKERFSSNVRLVYINFWSNFVIILRFCYTAPRFLSSFQLLVNNELFHQSSFYLKYIVSSAQLLFKKSYLHFSLGGKSPGGKCPRPVQLGLHLPGVRYLTRLSGILALYQV